MQGKLSSLREEEKARKDKIEELGKKVTNLEAVLRDSPAVDEAQARRVEAKRVSRIERSVGIPLTQVSTRYTDQHSQRDSASRRS